MRKGCTYTWKPVLRRSIKGGTRTRRLDHEEPLRRCGNEIADGYLDSMCGCTEDGQRSVVRLWETVWWGLQDIGRAYFERRRPL